jgi:choline-phosphate cytidylyltransferase
MSKRAKNSDSSPSKKRLSIEYDDFTTLDANAHLKTYKPPNDRPVRVYCDGIYDLFHYGHARALQQAKLLFPRVHLIVGVSSDHDTAVHKGRTVLREHERYESVRHCRWVDEVLEGAPWSITQDFVDKHEIDFVCHDDTPYPSSADGSGDIYGWLKAQGRFIATKRTTAISTSDLITRILHDYDAFVQRNLERGYSADQLNLSSMKRREWKVKQLGKRLRTEWQKQEDTVKDNWKSSAEELVDGLERVRSGLPRDFADFAALFDSFSQRWQLK